MADHYGVIIGIQRILIQYLLKLPRHRSEVLQEHNEDDYEDGWECCLRYPLIQVELDVDEVELIQFSEYTDLVLVVTELIKAILITLILSIIKSAYGGELLLLVLVKYKVSIWSRAISH